MHALIVPSCAEQQIITQNQTIQKVGPPVGITAVWCAGGGGGGGGGVFPSGYGVNSGGGGGGGGANDFRLFDTESLPDTMRCVVGVGGAGGAAGIYDTSVTAQNGEAGSASYIQDAATNAVIVRGYGGGGGYKAKFIPSLGTYVPGGGGGGLSSAGMGGAQYGTGGDSPTLDYDTVLPNSYSSRVWGGGWATTQGLGGAEVTSCYSGSSVFGGGAGESENGLARSYAGTSQFGGNGGAVGSYFAQDISAQHLEIPIRGYDCTPFCHGAGGGKYGLVWWYSNPTAMPDDMHVPPHGGLGGGGGGGGRTPSVLLNVPPSAGGNGGNGLIATASWAAVKVQLIGAGVHGITPPPNTRFVYIHDGATWKFYPLLVLKQGFHLTVTTETVTLYFW